MLGARALLLMCAGFLGTSSTAAGADPLVIWGTPAAIDSSLSSNYADNSIAVDSLGRPHVAYFDYSTHDIRYASRSNDSWSVDTLESGTGFDFVSADAPPSLALDRAGRPHVAYSALRNGTPVVVYAVKREGEWSREIVGEAPDGVWFPSLAINSHDEPFVAFDRYDGSIWQVLLSERVSGQWSTQVVDEGVFSALALDWRGDPRLVYSGMTNGVFGKVRYAARTGPSWTIEQLDRSASRNRLVLGATGQPHISCKSGSYLEYITKTGDAWSYTTVGQGPTDGHGAPLALDRRGGPVMLFIDNLSHYLTWAWLETGVWNQASIESDGVPIWANTPALAIDPAGQPWITYQIKPTLMCIEGVEGGRTPQTIVMDGVDDFLLVNRVEAEPGDTEYPDIDLVRVYVTNDATRLFIGATLREPAMSGLQLGVAVDVETPDGGPTDPWQKRIDWSQAIHRPDHVFYVDLDSGQQQGFSWDGEMWAALPAPGPGSFVWASGVNFHELAIPLSALSVSAGAPINIELWVTQSGETRGPLDCAANDAVQLSTPFGTIWETETSTSLTAYHSVTVLGAQASGVGRSRSPAITLSSLSPNPSAGRSSVTFTIPVPTWVRVSLTDVQGRTVAMMADGMREAGRHTVAVDARALSAGVYFVRMQARGEDLARRLVVLR